MIVLVGMPGSGKSSAGRQVARRFGLPFVDSDHEIEQQIGMSIREYFETQGEQAFRDLETALLRRVAESSEQIVLSTGGGALLREENRDILRQHGTVLYLRASPEEIYRRLRHDTKRPLLQVADPRQKLQELFQTRDPLYLKAAHYVIDTGRSSIQVLVSHIAMQLEMAGLVPQGETPPRPPRAPGPQGRRSRG